MKGQGMEWQCDDVGRLALAGIHDALLMRLTVDADARTLELRLRGASGERVCLIYADVVMMNGQAIWETGIVNTVFVWRLREVPIEFLDAPSAGWRPLLEERLSRTAAIEPERHRLSAKLPDGYLSTVVCSYGGNLSVLAGSLSVKEWN